MKDWGMRPAIAVRLATNGSGVCNRLPDGVLQLWYV